MDMTLNGVEFYWSEVCQEYQYQTTSAEEYEKVQMVLVINGWNLTEESDDYAYYEKEEESVYVERNY